MHPRRTNKKWDKKQTALIKEYAWEHRDHIRSRFYENIFAGRMQFRKVKGFFVKLAAKLGKSSEKCKSKFQKMEKTIYVETLRIPQSHYDTFQYLRRGKELIADKIRPGTESPVCLCAHESQPSIRSARKGEAQTSETQVLRGAGRHVLFENSRIKIILNYKAGLLGSVKLGTLN